MQLRRHISLSSFKYYLHHTLFLSNLYTLGPIFLPLRGCTGPQPPYLGPTAPSLDAQSHSATAPIEQVKLLRLFPPIFSQFLFQHALYSARHLHHSRALNTTHNGCLEYVRAQEQVQNWRVFSRARIIITITSGTLIAYLHPSLGITGRLPPLSPPSPLSSQHR